jgi:hypothetical protein
MGNRPIWPGFVNLKPRFVNRDSVKSNRFNAHRLAIFGDDCNALSFHRNPFGHEEKKKGLIIAPRSVAVRPVERANTNAIIKPSYSPANLAPLPHGFARESEQFIA